MRRSEADWTAVDPTAPRYAVLRERPPERVIRGRNRTKADILVYRAGTLRVAIKDYASRPWWVRQTIGRLFVRRECAAYRAAGTIEGLPRFFGRLGPWTLATQLVPGRPLAERPAAASEPAVFDRLDALLAAIHARGVALGDLHHRDVLLGDDGRVWVVDLATAVVRRADSRSTLLERFQAADRHAARRMRRRHVGGGTDDPDAVNEPAASWHRRGRRLKRIWDGARRRRTRALGLLRLVLVYVLLGAMLWLSRPSWITLALGAPLVALGEALRLWSAGHLLKTDELITSGPYRHTRNPLYLGRLLIFSGIALAAGPAGWWTLVPGWAVFFLYYLPRKERVEPARLLARHGEPYRRYRDAIPALWPTPRGYGEADRTRRWSLRRMRRNREHWMVIGLLVLLGALAWRAYGG